MKLKASSEMKYLTWFLLVIPISTSFPATGKELIRCSTMNGRSSPAEISRDKDGLTIEWRDGRNLIRLRRDKSGDTEFNDSRWFTDQYGKNWSRMSGSGIAFWSDESNQSPIRCELPQV